MTALQIAALFYVIFYCGILLGFRGYLLYKNTGINTIKSRKKTGIEGFVEKVLRVCFVLILVIVINYVFIESNYKLLVPISYLENLTIGYIGIALSMLGLLFGFIAQLQMGDSWRLGLDENEKINLVAQGIYAYSRNPIYLGYLISLVGFFMMMPNAFSLCLLLVSYVAIGIKVRLEENYLLRTKGKEYKRYFDSVRRWM